MIPLGPGVKTASHRRGLQHHVAEKLARETRERAGCSDRLCVISNLAAFHTCTAVWTENSITISYGQTCLTDYWVPARPLVKPEPFDPATAPLPATREVDDVRAWK